MTNDFERIIFTLSHGIFLPRQSWQRTNCSKVIKWLVRGDIVLTFPPIWSTMIFPSEKKHYWKKKKKKDRRVLHPRFKHRSRPRFPPNLSFCRIIERVGEWEKTIADRSIEGKLREQRVCRFAWIVSSTSFHTQVWNLEMFVFYSNFFAGVKIRKWTS